MAHQDEGTSCSTRTGRNTWGEEKFSDTLLKEANDTLLEKAQSIIILCLSDKVIRKVAKDKSAAYVWTKLESLYMTKSLTNQLFMKQRLYSYKLTEDKGMEDQIDEFNKVLDDLENLYIKLEDSDKTIMLLNTLPKSYDHLKDVMLFGLENSISLDEVQSTLKAKELQKSNEGQQTSSTQESLNIEQKFSKNGNNFKKTTTDSKKPAQNKSKNQE